VYKLLLLLLFAIKLLLQRLLQAGMCTHIDAAFCRHTAADILLLLYVDVLLLLLLLAALMLPAASTTIPRLQMR
jgi:hypothetical protein